MDTNNTQKADIQGGEETKGRSQVTIYSTPSCHYCHMAKEYFAKNSIKYTDYNVAEDVEKRTEMLERSGQMGVPVIFIGDEMVVGFSEPHIRHLLSLLEEKV